MLHVVRRYKNKLKFINIQGKKKKKTNVIFDVLNTILQ